MLTSYTGRNTEYISILSIDHDITKLSSYKMIQEDVAKK